MKLTKEQLQDMSDFEVNKKLEVLTGMYCEDFSGNYIKTMDYCNNPSDIMPAALAHNISLIKLMDDVRYFAEYTCTIDESSFVLCSKLSCEHTNPYRAMACCLILILQEET